MKSALLALAVLLGVAAGSATLAPASAAGFVNYEAGGGGGTNG